MESKLYQWNRFWVPRDGAFSFDSDGFLLAPHEDGSRRKTYRTDAVEFREISDRQCLILLGSPELGRVLPYVQKVKLFIPFRPILVVMQVTNA